MKNHKHNKQETCEMPDSQFENRYLHTLAANSVRSLRLCVGVIAGDFLVKDPA